MTDGARWSRRLGVAVIILASALVGCATLRGRGSVSATAVLPKPRPLHSMMSVLGQTAAVAEGRVSNVHFDYDSVRGPRTVTTLSDFRVHLGSVGHTPSQLRLDSFGGPLPNGKSMYEAHTPSFEQGQRILMFLRNTSWFFSPVVGPMVFSIERLAGKEILLTGVGATVTGIDHAGLRTGAVVRPRDPDGTRPAALPPWVNSKTVESAFGVREFVTAVQRLSADTGVPIGGTFHPTPISNRPRWNVFPTARAGPAPQPEKRELCFKDIRPGDDADDGDVRACLQGGQR